MKVKILDIKTLNELDNYWTNEDFSNLLELFDFPDAQSVKPAELKEMLFMAITDFEPNESAEIILTYKLGDKLNEGQIQSLSHEMKEDKVAEEYPEPALHYDLFNINQLLFKAYNGKFPNTEATKLQFEIVDNGGIEVGEDKELMAKIVAGALGEKSLVKRLFAEQLDGTAKFEDAHKFIWTITKNTETQFEILTSNYWISDEDIEAMEYDVTIKNFDEE
ncbi:MAG: hypothetical protein KGV44_11065 [Flavobacteriaceae bacterium]|nr:hypothetical protein [Flavobacteriaceae bacterium]